MSEAREVRPRPVTPAAPKLDPKKLRARPRVSDQQRLDALVTQLARRRRQR